MLLGVVCICRGRRRRRHHHLLFVPKFELVEKIEDATGGAGAGAVVVEAFAKDERSLADEENANKEEDNNINNPQNNPYDPNKPLNIIVFYPDDWSSRDLQDVNPTLQTPTFTQLAKEGMRFTKNAVTTSICWISRATYFTGQYISGHKSMYLNRPLFTHPENWNYTWPHLLRQSAANYFVGHVGKWQYQDNPRNPMRSTALFDWSSYFEGWTVVFDKAGKRIFNAEIAKNETLRFLRERPKDKPFAVTVAFYPPKGIFNVTEVKPELAALYNNVHHPEAYSRQEALRLLPVFLQNNDTYARSRYLYRFEVGGDYQENMIAQYATITHIDQMCGEILEELKAQGEYNNTLVIVTADNGEFHGAHALSDKWYPYSESIHVPLIIKDPRMPANKRGTLDHSFTLNIDLATTILNAAGLEPPLAANGSRIMEGRNIADLYLNQQPQPTSSNNNNNPPNSKSTSTLLPWRDKFYYIFPPVAWEKIPASEAIVTHKWKYIHWYLNDAEELFDLQNDPFELHNVANLTQHSTLKAQLKQQLLEEKHYVYYPRIPETRCDPVQPRGTDRKSMGNCSKIIPFANNSKYCCPNWFDESTMI